MSQSALSIPGSPLTMSTLKTTLEAIFAAINTIQSGATAPSSAVQGSLWLDTSGTPTYILKLYTTTAGWISIVSVNITTGAVSFYRTGGTALTSAFALTLLDDADAAAALATLGVATATLTLTNKRVTKRVTSIVSAAEPTINTDNCDYVEITALAEAITSMTTNLSGTPTKGQTLWINIVGTDTRAITWGASFEGTLLPDKVASGKRLDVGLVWNNRTSKWRCVSVNHE